VHAARGATKKEVFAVIQIQRYKVVLPLVLVVRRDVEILSEAQPATQRSGAFGCVEKRNLRDFVLSVGGVRECRDEENGGSKTDSSDA
jgi:hypothetical protein